MDIYNVEKSNNSLKIKDSVKREIYQESFVFMDEAEYEYFEERAAIMEFEGNMDREEAELMAYQGIILNRNKYSKAS
jgi:hypothetical protein